MSKEGQFPDVSAPEFSPEMSGECNVSSVGPDRPGFGFWQCSLDSRRILLDGRCSAILGFEDAVAHEIGLDEWKQRLHPDEGDFVLCRYQMLLEQDALGDVLEDSLRVRHENGEYKRVVLRGSVMDRAESGRARLLAGSLTDAEVAAEGHWPSAGVAIDSGRLLLAMGAAGDGLWDWDAQTDNVYYSPRYLDMLGYTAEEFPGQLDIWKQKIHPEDVDKIVPPQQKIVESSTYGDTFECTYRIRHKDGSWAWILGRGYVTHRDAEGKAVRLVGLHTNITTVQRDRDKLEELVRNDVLTGLRSRSFCDLEIERIEKGGIRPISIISCDLDGLKLVNDYLGHAEGDKLLIKAATILRNSLRVTDCVARMGGDEFVMLLPGCTEETAAGIKADIEKNMAACSASIGEIPVMASLGLASTDKVDVPVAKVLMAADRRMLRDKSTHRIAAHRRIKDWIELHSHIHVSLEDNRYSG